MYTERLTTGTGKLLKEPAGGVQRKSVSDRITRLEGLEKEDMVRFLSQLLTWLPEKRRTASELLEQLHLEDHTTRHIKDTKLKS
jgi:hypothetical protein